MKRTKRRTGYNNLQPGYSIIFDVSTRQEIPWKMYKNYVWPILKYGDIMLSSITEEQSLLTENERPVKSFQGLLLGLAHRQFTTSWDGLRWMAQLNEWI